MKKKLLSASINTENGVREFASVIGFEFWGLGFGYWVPLTENKASHKLMATNTYLVVCVCLFCEIHLILCVCVCVYIYDKYVFIANGLC